MKDLYSEVWEKEFDFPNNNKGSPVLKVEVPLDNMKSDKISSSVQHHN